MALKQLPGYSSGYVAARYSSMNKRALGKFTDANHLSQLHSDAPADYDKKIISLYTQTSLYANDFLQMLQKSTPYFIDKNTDYWKWKVVVPYQFPVIVGIPDATLALAPYIGINRQPFELIYDKQEWGINDVITGNKMYGQQFIILEDPSPVITGWSYKLQLVSKNPMTTSVDPQWLAVGREYQFLYNSIGEFDDKFSGLGSLGDEIILYESLGSGMGVEHTVTDWADTRSIGNIALPTDKYGNAADLIMYGKKVRNAKGEVKMITAWEPFVEMELRKKMLEMKVGKMIWAQGGTSQSHGGKQELKKLSTGIYPTMRRFGNYEQYNDGEFSINLLRNVFGDLFYRRTDMKDRHVEMFTNEAGFEVFRTANKDDLLKAGFTIVAGLNDRFIQGQGQHMIINWAFDQTVTMETGNIKLSHLMELDLPQTNSEFGRNKKSTPVFLVFDVSPDSNGQLQNNFREVRQKGSPSMTWGYIDGTYSHLGHAASKGMQSANKFPGYTIWMKDRYDVFIEDITRTVVIEQVPQF